MLGPCQVRTGLFLGCHSDQEDAAVLQGLGITHVLQVGAELHPSHPALFRYKTVALYDMEDEHLLLKLQPCFSFIEGARIEGAVLVHCLAGVSRSASVVIGYLMWRESMSFESSFQEVQLARPIINPNRGFVRQLNEFERLGCDFTCKEATVAAVKPCGNVVHAYGCHPPPRAYLHI